SIAVVMGLVLLVPIALAAFYLGKSAQKSRPGDFRQLTFRRGFIRSARFAPDGQTVVYSAGWGGDPLDLFWVRPGIPETRPQGLPGAMLLSISPSGELALLLGVDANRLPLATRPPLGGAPRELLAHSLY